MIYIFVIAIVLLVVLTARTGPIGGVAWSIGRRRTLTIEWLAARDHLRPAKQVQFWPGKGKVTRWWIGPLFVKWMVRDE